MSAQLEDRYSLKLPLGRNVAGAVWHAEPKDGGAPVAVALLDLEDVEDRTLRKRAATRFRRDLSLLRQLNHPNVVRVLDVGRSKEGHPYAAMERLDGVSLTDWLEPSPSGSERVRLATGLLEGLDAAHRSGVIHGDLEPGNVLIAAGDTPKLIAFGLNRALARQTHSGWIETSGVSRTLTFRAPEQAAGRGGRSVDIYGAGLLLHLICSGELPKDGRSTLRETAARLPAGLVAVIERALHEDPEERHPSIAAMRKGWADAVSVARDAVRSAVGGFRSDSTPPRPDDESGSRTSLIPTDDEETGRPSLLSVGVALPEEDDEDSLDDAPAAPKALGRIPLKQRAVPRRVAAVEVSENIALQAADKPVDARSGLGPKKDADVAAAEMAPPSAPADASSTKTPAAKVAAKTPAGDTAAAKAPAAKAAAKTPVAKAAAKAPAAKAAAKTPAGATAAPKAPASAVAGAKAGAAPAEAKDAAETGAESSDLASIPPSRRNVIATPPPAPAPRTIAERFSNPPPASDGDEDRTSDDGLDRISLSDALEDGLFTGEGGEDEGEDVERISLSDALAPTDPQPVPRVPKAAPVPQAAPVRKAAPLAPAAPVPAAPVPAGEEPSSNGWLLGVAAIALIGAGGWYVAQQGNAVEPNVANAPSDDSTANPVAETTASNETSAPEPAAPAEPAEPASIRLHGVPTDARAFLDDDFIGAQTSGPLTVSVPQDGERHEISVRVGDDTRWTRSLVATEPLDLLVVIEGLEAAPEPEPE
ncbi:MAG: serine/threonine-protein kinase, partial [Myxococcota bacterium]